MYNLLTRRHHAIVRQLAQHGPNAPIRRRAEILLLYDEGLKTREVAERMSQTPHTVLRWRREYRRDGMAVFPPRALAAVAGAVEEPPFALAPPETEAATPSVVEEPETVDVPGTEVDDQVEDKAEEAEEAQPAATPAIVIAQDGSTSLDRLLADVQAAGPYSVIVVVQQATSKQKKSKKASDAGRRSGKKGSGKAKAKGKKQAGKKGAKKKKKRKK